MSEPQKRIPRGKYFDDFEIGATFVTPRRTVTQTDIVNFACLSGDFNPPHVDHEYCKEQPYGEPIAHGPLVLAIAAGLQCQTGINDGTIVAMMGIDKWRIHAPVKHGDTIHQVATVHDKKLTSRGDRGIVTFLREIKNQRDEIVHTLEVSAMYLCRPQGVTP
jgi:acyl dehydratase